jgi:Protein of unknown function (DUF3300)
MKRKTARSIFLWRMARYCLAVLCSAVIVPVDGPFAAQSQPQTNPATQQEAAKIPPDQLDSLVAPIALYPDPLLAQTLAACTYPLELIQLQQWLAKNSGLKDKALADAVAKQPWDPSIQAMAALPDVVKRLADDIQWTTDLGNAFLAQQSDVMDAVQRMRKKAQEKGNLKSTEQQKVETKVIENKSTGLSLPSHLLSALGLLRRGGGDFVRRWRDDGGILERRVGVGLRVGRQQRHYYQQQQQFQPQLEH